MARALIRGEKEGQREGVFLFLSTRRSIVYLALGDELYRSPRARALIRLPFL